MDRDVFLHGMGDRPHRAQFEAFITSCPCSFLSIRRPAGVQDEAMNVWGILQRWLVAGLLGFVAVAGCAESHERVERPDASRDATLDASFVDASFDASVDASSDATLEAAMDASLDADAGEPPCPFVSERYEPLEPWSSVDPSSFSCMPSSYPPAMDGWILTAYRDETGRTWDVHGQFDTRIDVGVGVLFGDTWCNGYDCGFVATGECLSEVSAGRNQKGCPSIPDSCLAHERGPMLALNRATYLRLAPDGLAFFDAAGQWLVVYRRTSEMK